MTKLTLLLTVAALSITFAAAAYAYPTDPAADTLRVISEGTPLGSQTQTLADVCAVKPSTIVASLIELPKELTSDQTKTDQLACATE